MTVRKVRIFKDSDDVPWWRQKIERVQEVRDVVVIDERAVETDHQSTKQPSSDKINDRLRRPVEHTHQAARICAQRERCAIRKFPQRIPSTSEIRDREDIFGNIDIAAQWKPRICC